MIQTNSKSVINKTSLSSYHNHSCINYQFLYLLKHRMTKQILKVLSDDYCLHNKRRGNDEHQFTCISVYLQQMITTNSPVQRNTVKSSEILHQMTFSDIIFQIFCTPHIQKLICTGPINYFSFPQLP